MKASEPGTGALSHANRGHIVIEPDAALVDERPLLPALTSGNLPVAKRSDGSCVPAVPSDAPDKDPRVNFWHKRLINLGYMIVKESPEENVYERTARRSSSGPLARSFPLWACLQPPVGWVLAAALTQAFPR